MYVYYNICITHNFGTLTWMNQTDEARGQRAGERRGRQMVQGAAAALPHRKRGPRCVARLAEARAREDAVTVAASGVLARTTAACDMDEVAAAEAVIARSSAEAAVLLRAADANTDGVLDEEEYRRAGLGGRG